MRHIVEFLEEEEAFFILDVHNIPILDSKTHAKALFTFFEAFNPRQMNKLHLQIGTIFVDPPTHFLTILIYILLVNNSHPR